MLKVSSYSPEKRVLINTVAQHVRTLANVVFSFLMVRLLLHELGESDYGIYALIAGIVALLSFITRALTTTTQRFLSYYTQSPLEKRKEIFSNSLFMHAVIAVLLVIGIEGVAPFLFDGFLSIDTSRLYAAKIVYQMVIVLITFNVLLAPYRALLVSYENLTIVSLFEVIVALLRLVGALVLPVFSGDSLVVYGVMIAIISIINWSLFFAYCRWHYLEAIGHRLIGKPSQVFIKETSNFAWWTMYSMGCIVGQVQGLAIIFNRELGTVANAAYGISLQIFTALVMIPGALRSALDPQIMKSEGDGDSEKMLWLSEFLSKFSFILLAFIAIPCIMEMGYLLKLWLKTVPPYTVFFCRMFMFSSLIDQLTMGLTSANLAKGKVRLFSIVIDTTKFLCIPATVILIRLVPSAEVASLAMWLFFSFETLAAILRMFVIRKKAGLKIGAFISNVVGKLVIPVAVTLVFDFAVMHWFDEGWWRVITIFVGSTAIFSIMLMWLGLNEKEKLMMTKMFVRKRKKIENVK